MWPGEIKIIKYLPRVDYYVLLHDKQLTILTQQNLKPVQDYKVKKITNFCLNEEVYRGGTSNRNVSLNDQICICANNTLHFLEAEFVNRMTRFTEDSHPDRRSGFQINMQPEQMVWDGDKIYLAWKRQTGRKVLLEKMQ
mmetsp:Transcript_29500/g.36598  ORF Transcript_29500/g.36598 Transcript_29500/m.36598 type:complete len:139 (+) Transcript_29500:268-684(+)